MMAMIENILIETVINLLGHQFRYLGDWTKNIIRGFYARNDKVIIVDSFVV